MQRALTVYRALGAALALVAFAAAMFGAAGRLDWMRGWAYLALLLGAQGASTLVVGRRDPELLRRRARAGAGTPAWDFACLALFGLGYLGAVLLAAFDIGRGGSGLPIGAALAGGAALLAGTGLLTWAMAVNTHFEKTVRLQHDRDHRVVERGPYRFVRHPGYVGAALAFPLAAPAILGSAWAVLPALLATAALIVRTALEDRFLRRRLEGYAAYAARVPYRLVPGLW